MTIIRITPTTMDTSFKKFVKDSWQEYLFPNVSTLILFTVSFIMTNIGLYAIPSCLGVLVVLNVITTHALHNRWKLLQTIMQNQAALLRGK